MQFCQLIKMALCSCTEFLLEDHYFPCSKFWYLVLSLQIKGREVKEEKLLHINTQEHGFLVEAVIGNTMN